MAELEFPEDGPTIEDVIDQLQGIVIMQMRIYDVLTVMAAKQSPAKTAELLERHKNGKIAGPPLWWTPDDNDEESS